LRDPEFAQPHRLDRLEDPRLNAVVSRLDFKRRRPRPPGWPASASSGARPADRIPPGPAPCNPRNRRRQAESRAVASCQDVARQGFPIDREPKGSADPRIVERWPPHVKAEEKRLKKRVGPQALGRVAPVCGDLGNREPVGDVKLPGAEIALLDLGAFRGEKHDPVQGHRRRVPIERIRAVTRRALGVQVSSVNGPFPTRLPGRVQAVPRRSIAPNRCRTLGSMGNHGGWAARIGRYGVECASSIRMVRGSGARNRAPRIGDPPLVERLRIPHRIKEVCVFRSERGGEIPPPRRHKSVGRQSSPFFDQVNPGLR